MGVAIFYSQIICAITVLILASLILIVPAVILSRKNRKKARNVVCGVMGTMVLGAGILIAWLVTHSSYPQINNLKFLGKNIDDISLEYEFDYTENNDDGTGYVDLGLDNLYEFDDEGKLVGDTDGTWFAIDGLAVPYYFESEMKDENGKVVTQGRVPVLLDGVRANLIIVFDSEHTNGYIAGARYDYKDGETETIAKGITEIPEGTKIDFLADYYKYDQTYDDSFMWGEQITYSKDIKLSYVTIGDGIRVTYLLTDIYGREYWTPAVPN